MLTRKNDGIGEQRDLGSVGIDVYQPLNVKARGGRDVSGLLNAVNQLGGIAAKQVAINKEKDTAQGQRDAHLGKVDEELAKDSEAYAEGAAAVNDETAGMKWMNQARSDLERAAQEPDFDFAQWSAGQKQFFAEDSAAGVSKYGKQRINGFMAQFDQQMGSMHTSIAAKANLKRSTNALAENFLEFRNNGLSTVEQMKAYDATRGEQSGLMPEEREAIYGTALLTSVTEAKDTAGIDQAMELAKGFGLLNNPEWSEHFNKQREMTANRIARETLEAEKGNLEKRLTVDTELTNLAMQGRLTIPYLVNRRQAGEILPEEATRAWDAQQAEQKRRQIQAERELAKAQKVQASRQQLGAILEAGQAQRIAGTGYKPSEVQEELDRRLLESMQSARDNPESGLDAVGANLALGRRNGLMPTAVKNMFNTIDPGAPKEYASTFELYRNLKAKNMGRYVEQHIERTALAQLNRVDDLVRTGVPMERALEMMASANVSAEDAEKQMAFQFKAIEAGWRDIGGDVTITGPARKDFEAIIKANMMTGVHPQAAINASKKQWEEQYTVSNGIAYAKGMVSEEFEDHVETYTDDVLIPHLRQPEVLGERAPKKLIAFPVPGQPGRLMFAPPDRSAGVLRNAAGELWVVDESTMQIEATTKRQQVAQEQDTAKRMYDYHFSTERMHIGIFPPSSRGDEVAWWRELPQAEKDRLIQKEQGAN